MFPIKDMSDYVTEMQRLFSRPLQSETISTNIYHNASMHSPFQITNRSSSSADSTSPDSYPDLSLFVTQQHEQIHPHMFETPHPRGQSMPRRRPIVGRKILGSQASQVQPIASSPKTEELAWQSDDSAVFCPRTPPNTQKMFYEQKSYYELFPSEKPVHTPVKPSVSPTTSNYSPRSLTFSPTLSNFSPTFPSFTPSMPQSPSVSRQSQYNITLPMNYSNIMKSNAGSSMSQKDNSKMCSFCRKNGETALVYMTHAVKEKVGNRHIVTCPILRSHVCSTCGASGDNAHTITYCPVLRTSNNGAPLKSTTITLKNTRMKSNGRRRF